MENVYDNHPLSVTTPCEGIWYAFLEVRVTTTAESPTRILRGFW
jgi:hypothetical protein